jgi:hypothetical protein
MPAQSPTSSLPSVTLAELVALQAADRLEVVVRQVNACFVPLAYTTPPGQARIALGVVVHDGSIMASLDLDGLVQALHDLLGEAASIRVAPYHPDSPSAWRH